MRIPRSRLIQGALALAAGIALLLAVVSAYVLPRKAGALHLENAHLTRRLAAVERPAGPGPATPLPAVASLPARAANLLDMVEAAGGSGLHYTLGERRMDGPVAVQPVRIGFEGGVHALARVLARIEAAAPAVALGAVELERGDAGRIDVILRLDLLGAA